LKINFTFLKFSFASDVRFVNLGSGIALTLEILDDGDEWSRSLLPPFFNTALVKLRHVIKLSLLSGD